MSVDALDGFVLEKDGNGIFQSLGRFPGLLNGAPGELIFHLPLNLFGFRPVARPGFLPVLRSVVTPPQVLPAIALSVQLIYLFAIAAVTDEDGD